MLNNLVLGRYYACKSKIHSMHPLAKIICLIIFIVMVFICNDLKLMILLSLFGILLSLMASLPSNLYLKTVLSLKYLIVFIVIINLIFKYPLDTTIITILRLIMIVLYSSILTLTTTSSDINYGLQMFLSPLKIIKFPVNRIAFSISLALRFIPTIIMQANKILKSQAARGIDYYNSNFKDKLNAIKAMLIPMFVLTLKRADTLADTMSVRSYNIDSSHSRMHIYRWTLFDTYMLLIHLTILILIIYRYI